MTDTKSLKLRRSWGPPLGFALVVLAVIGLLYWMGQPPRRSEPSAAASEASANAALQAAGADPSAQPTSENLCSVDQVKHFIAEQLDGEVSDTDLTFVSQEIMAELHQQRQAPNGCVSRAGVAELLYQMAEELEPGN